MILAKPPVHVLIVDDQASVRSALRVGLEAEGFLVSEAGSKAALMSRLERQPPVDLITLDLLLGDENGLSLAREIRAKRNVPIVMITALTHPVDRVTGLEHGADDYVVKPFHIREVLMRIHSVLRRYELERSTEAADTHSQDVEIYESDFGTINVDQRAALAASGNAIDLTDTEFDLLVAFLRNPTRVLSRDQLTMMTKGRMWSPTDRTLDGHIARLRKKIEPDLETPRIIKTVWRVGYVFAAPVRRINPT